MKKLFSLVLTFTMVFATPIFAHSSEQPIVSENGSALETLIINGTQITIYPEAQAIPQDMIEDLAAENPQGNVIIYEYYDVDALV